MNEKWRKSVLTGEALAQRLADNRHRAMARLEEARRLMSQSLCTEGTDLIAQVQAALVERGLADY